MSEPSACEFAHTNPSSSPSSSSFSLSIKTPRNCIISMKIRSFMTSQDHQTARMIIMTTHDHDRTNARMIGLEEGGARLVAWHGMEVE